MNVDLRLWRAFVAVAETENVGRAAERLAISQSPLSRQIMRIEAAFGLALFERTRQRLRLTDEGRLMLVEARAVLAQAARAEATARRLARGDSGPLAIGYVEAAMHSGVLPRALARLRKRRPGVTPELVWQRSAEQVVALDDRRIDVGLLYTPPEEGRFLVEPVLSEPVTLVLPVGHPLAGKAEILPGDLDALPWIALNRARNPARDRFLATCAAAGFTPDIVMEAEDLLAVLQLVAVGLGVAMVQASLDGTLAGEVVCRSVPWFPFRVRLSMVTRADDPKPLVAAFRECLPSPV
jgi:DNA-binding transcriptional LysR family regulator